MEPGSIATNQEMAQAADVSVKTIQQAKVAQYDLRQLRK
jgi:DNA-binding XRE family transcriptional regulator